MRQHPLLDNPELKKQLLGNTASYPANHCSNDAIVALATRRLLTQPGNWFKRPAANPLAGQKYFPGFDSLPDEHDYDEDFYRDGNFRKFWILLAEITDATAAGVSFLRNEVHATDKAGRMFPVCFYPDSDSGLFNYRTLRRNSTLAFFCPTSHRFLDGRVGLRVEQLENLRVLPMPLAAVLRTSELLHACSVHKCWQCRSAQKRPLMRCKGCGYARYCGPACQADDWARHRAECGPGGCVRQVAKLVYFTYGTAVQQEERDGISMAHPLDLFSAGER